MKKNNFKLLLAVSGCSLLMSSCYKKFDPKSYAPAVDINGFSSSKEIAPANLVAYWAFDGTYADSVSSTAGVNTGTTFAPGIKGQAMQGALNSYVLTDPSPAVTGLKSFTLGFWVNSPLHPAGMAGIFALSNQNQFWGNIELFLENGGTLEKAKMRIKVINNGTSEIGIDKDEILNVYTKWTHMVLSYDQESSTFKFYVNGSKLLDRVQTGLGALNLVNSGKIVFGAAQFMTTPSLTSGHGAEPWASYFIGRLDEFKIYNKALSDLEISSWTILEGRGK